MKYKIDLFFQVVQGCDPSTIFVKKSNSDVPPSLNTILQKPIINVLKSYAADLFAN